MRTDGVLDMGLLRLPVYARCCSPCHPSWEGLGCDYLFLFVRVFSLAARCYSLVVLTHPSLQEKRDQLRFVFSRDGLSGRQQSRICRPLTDIQLCNPACFYLLTLPGNS